jgi:hypothetical protein
MNEPYILFANNQLQQSDKTSDDSTLAKIRKRKHLSKIILDAVD